MKNIFKMVALTIAVCLVMFIPATVAIAKSDGKKAATSTATINPYAPNGVGQGDNQGNGNAPANGTVGNADDKNPPGQAPGGNDSNNGYECDGNKGVGNNGGNPAHSGCTATPTPTTTVTPTTTPTSTPTGTPTSTPTKTVTPSPTVTPPIVCVIGPCGPPTKTPKPTPTVTPPITCEDIGHCAPPTQGPKPPKPTEPPGCEPVKANGTKPVPVSPTESDTAVAKTLPYTGTSEWIWPLGLILIGLGILLRVLPTLLTARR